MMVAKRKFSHLSARDRLPNFYVQFFNRIEMCVTGSKPQIVLEAEGGNPNIIFGDWLPFPA
jgi:hypothetical protein